MGLGGLLVLISAMLLIAINPTNTEALPKITEIGVTLSKTCIIQHENNFTTSCPTYEEILMLYPDTSNHVISGGFEYNEYGFLERGGTVYNNHHNYYEYTEFTFWVDPPGDIIGSIPMITIVPQLPPYKIPGVSNKLVNNTMILGENLWLDSQCYDATIGAKYWLDFFSSVYLFMYKDCPEEDRPDTRKIIQFNATHQDITTSYKYQLDKWIAETKINCLTICNEY